jgi:DnaJ-class molecular chaperone
VSRAWKRVKVETSRRDLFSLFYHVEHDVRFDLSKYWLAGYCRTCQGKYGDMLILEISNRPIGEVNIACGLCDGTGMVYEQSRGGTLWEKKCPDCDGSRTETIRRDEFLQRNLEAREMKIADAKKKEAAIKEADGE